jgi:membrane-bound lytic murein transglycosylase B
MPSNIKKFAVDGNGDKKIDLFDKADAIFSIGNYLKIKRLVRRHVICRKKTRSHKALQ